MAEKVLRILNRMLDFFIVLVCLLAGIYSVYSIWDNSQIYAESLDLQIQLRELKPEESAPSFAELQKINPDVAAWITLNGTQIDHPILQGKDNLEYLNKDIYGDHSLSGSLFLDSRCSQDFQNVYSLVYGHHMEKHQMFGDLQLYLEEAFFEENKDGTLLVPQKTYPIEIFAVMTVDAMDAYIFEPERASEEQTEFLDYVEQHARYKRSTLIQEIKSEKRKILALTTCSTDAYQERVVVLAAYNEQG